MNEWLWLIYAKCRDLRSKALDATAHLEGEEKEAAKAVNGYMKSDYDALVELWRQLDPDMKVVPQRLGDFARHIRFGEPQDYRDIVRVDIPDIETFAEKTVRERGKEFTPMGFEDLLHPAITENSLNHYRNGHLRDAVLNGVIAVFDMIRARTKLDLDGAKLVGQAFGMEKGKLIFSEVDSESGQNDQKGFMQIFEGVYTGVRNVKAHSLNHDLNEQKAAQYLVMLSLLARRVEECKDRT